MKIKIWDALNQSEEEATERECSGYVNGAVETFMEQRWSNCDYVETMEINVRFEDGKLLEFICHAEQTVIFRAKMKHYVVGGSVP
jgi:hypothetical protein